MNAVSTLIPLSVGFSAGKVSELHTRRVYSPSSADPALMDRNVHVIDPQWDDDEPGLQIISYRDQINYIFEEPIRKYNAKQKRKDRKKSLDYYAELTKEGSQIQPVYSYVLQLGNRNVCGTMDDTFDHDYYDSLPATEASEYALKHANDSELHERCMAALIDACEQFEERYPHFKVLAAVIHDDEIHGSCHATIDFTAVSTGFKRGVETRCGMSRALAQMGFAMGDKHAEHHYSIVNWQNDVKDWVASEIMPAHGLTRQVVGNDQPHRDVQEYKAWLRKQAREQAEKESQAENSMDDYEPSFGRKNVADEIDDKLPDVTENERLSIDMDAAIVTQQAQLATLVAEREREEKERDARRAKYLAEAQAERDEISRLREEAARLREQIGAEHRVLERLTRPLFSFVSWFCDKCKPSQRDTWETRFNDWIGRYETDMEKEIDRMKPVYNEPHEVDAIAEKTDVSR